MVSFFIVFKVVILYFEIQVLVIKVEGVDEEGQNRASIGGDVISLGVSCLFLESRFILVINWIMW